MSKTKLVFEKANYMLMLLGVAVLIAGFIVMNMDKEPYGFGTLGLTVGPIIVMIGFLIQFFAIFHKSKKQE
jgi:hypothetical protein